MSRAGRLGLPESVGEMSQPVPSQPVSVSQCQPVEVMPPNTNRGPSIGGGWIRLAGRKQAQGGCRDEVATALYALLARDGRSVFTVRDVYAEMVAAGTLYAETTVFKTMQRMKRAPKRPPLSSWNGREEKGSGSPIRADRSPALCEVIPDACYGCLLPRVRWLRAPIRARVKRG